MTPDATAHATANAVSGLSSHFMLDPGTYGAAAEHGYEGMDFYVAGRGGALGDVPGACVAAAFVFFNPDGVTEMWERTRLVAPPEVSGVRWAEACWAWAEAHLPDDLDAARLAELAGEAARGADAAGSPIFAAWRTLEEPSADRAKARALHRINGLRELRLSMHAAAVLAAGLTPLQALSIRTPHMVPVFGWAEAAEGAADLKPVWKEAEVATDVAFGRAAFGHLDEPTRQELADLLQQAHAATSA